MVFFFVRLGACVRNPCAHVHMFPVLFFFVSYNQKFPQVRNQLIQQSELGFMLWG
uniref:Uncharacterized protein n=1 Tax=Arundo donax TaxID=35708 RepID=A0A0A9AEG3_ARUDO